MQIEDTWTSPLKKLCFKRTMKQFFPEVFCRLRRLLKQLEIRAKSKSQNAHLNLIYALVLIKIEEKKKRRRIQGQASQSTASL